MQQVHALPLPLFPQSLQYVYSGSCCISIIFALFHCHCRYCAVTMQLRNCRKKWVERCTHLNIISVCWKEDKNYTSSESCCTSTLFQFVIFLSGAPTQRAEMFPGSERIPALIITIAALSFAASLPSFSSEYLGTIFYCLRVGVELIRVARAVMLWN